MERETSCPTCRQALNISPTPAPTANAPQPDVPEPAAGGPGGDAGPANVPRNRRNFFHFDGEFDRMDTLISFTYLGVIWSNYETYHTSNYVPSTVCKKSNLLVN